MKTNMLLTTASLVGEQRIVAHLGIVSGEAILGANIFRDFFAGIRDIVGERSAGYERSPLRSERYRDAGDDSAGTSTGCKRSNCD